MRTGCSTPRARSPRPRGAVPSAALPAPTQAHRDLPGREVANLVGVSRPRRNRALDRLRAAGWVKLEYGGLTVTDLDGLRRAADAARHGPHKTKRRPQGRRLPIR
ncbi:helix-turn-helix domain-containing protein [Rhizobacter sp. Root404]|uniref:helix-turn-helix domain-containing protein n=1 Tax=Rhizobacter sp. Root404 TaxID=1736528 RepID=UPI0009E9EBBC